MDRTNKTILAVDPGLREMGYAVLAGRRLVVHGVKSLESIPGPRKVTEARMCLRHWISAYKPRVLVLEATHTHPTGAFERVHRLAQALATTARRRRLRVVVTYPQTVRKHLVGHGWATKREAAQAVALRCPALRVYLTQDRRWKERYWLNMFDAVALALYHRDHPAKPPSRSRRCG